MAKIDEIESGRTISIGLCDDLAVDKQMHIYQTITGITDSRVRLLCDFSYRVRQMTMDGRLSFSIIKMLDDNQNSQHTQPKSMGNKVGNRVGNRLLMPSVIFLRKLRYKRLASSLPIT